MPPGDLDWLPASLVATGLVVLGWGYSIYTGTVDTIWPMFGMANQLLALIALSVVTTVLFNAGKARYAWVPLVPMAWVACTTTTAGYWEIRYKFYKWVQDGAVAKGWINIGLTTILLACVAIIVTAAAVRWVAVLRKPRTPNELAAEV